VDIILSDGQRKITPAEVEVAKKLRYFREE